MEAIINLKTTEKKQVDVIQSQSLWKRIDKSKSSRTKTQYVEDNKNRYELQRNGNAELKLNIRTKHEI